MSQAMDELTYAAGDIKNNITFKAIDGEIITGFYQLVIFKVPVNVTRFHSYIGQDDSQ